MISKTFFSNRTKESTTVILTDDFIYYITNDNVIKVKRDHSYHMNEDGLERIIDLYDDPRFNYWLENKEI